MQIQELINKHSKIKQILTEIEKLAENSELSKEIATKWAEMSDLDEWEDTINDPDFEWAEYQQELTEQLLELSEQYPVYQNTLTKLVQDLKLVEIQDEGFDFDEQIE